MKGAEALGLGGSIREAPPSVPLTSSTSRFSAVGWRCVQVTLQTRRFSSGSKAGPG